MMKFLLFPLLLVCYEILMYLSNDMYLPALPDIMQHLNISMHTAQLTLTMWFLGSALTPLFTGILTDRLGRRPILLSGGLIYILATLVCALTKSVPLFLLARFIEGGMIATMLVPGYACIHESFQQKEAIKILALMGSVNVLAPAFGPLLGSFVLYFGSWRAIFWFIAIATTVSVSLLYFYMPETHPREKHVPLEWKKVFKSYKVVLSNKNFLQQMLVLFFIFCGFLTWITAGPLLVITYLHKSAVVFGLVQALVFAANIAGTRLVKYGIEKVGVLETIEIGLFIVLTGGLILMVSTIQSPHSLTAFVVPMCIYSFGSGLCFAPLNRIVIQTTAEPMGVRVSLFTFLLMCSAALGSAASSIIFNGTTVSLASLVAVGGIVAWGIKHTEIESISSTKARKNS